MDFRKTKPRVLSVAHGLDLQDELDKGVVSAEVSGPFECEATVHYANCTGTRSSILTAGKRVVAQHYDYIFMMDYQECISELWTNDFDWVLNNSIVAGSVELTSEGALALRYLLTLIKRIYRNDHN